MITNKDVQSAELVLRVIDNVDCPMLMYEYEKNVVIKALEELKRKTGQWIPCSERLPENNRQVLVYARSVHYALAKYDEMREEDGTYKKQWVTFDAWKPFYTIKEVIAWMPLPEPYKERMGE